MYTLYADDNYIEINHPLDPLAPKQTIGLPTTAVESESFTVRGILEGIKRGRACVMVSPKAPTIDLQIGDVPMGESIDASALDKDLPVICQLSEPCIGVLKLFSSKGLYYETLLSGEDSKVELPQDKDSHFYRVEIWNRVDEENGSDEQIPICFSNPIFVNL